MRRLALTALLAVFAVGLALDPRKISSPLIGKPVPHFCPGMTRDFSIRDPKLLAGVKPDQKVKFEFVEDKGSLRHYLDQVDLRFREYFAFRGPGGLC